MSAELSRLTAEVEEVLRTIVLPGWGGPTHGMPDALFGYLMGVFARIDLCSAYWRGTFDMQSPRMVDFMTTFMRVGRFESSLALQFCRHKLMHTSSPRRLFDPSSGKTYHWLLHWGDEHLPRAEHFKIQPNGHILNVSLIALVEDLRVAMQAYLVELHRDTSLQTKYDTVERELSSYKYRIL